MRGTVCVGNSPCFSWDHPGCAGEDMRGVQKQGWAWDTGKGLWTLLNRPSETVKSIRDEERIGNKGRSRG